VIELKQFEMPTKPMLITVCAILLVIVKDKERLKKLLLREVDYVHTLLAAAQTGPCAEL